MRRGGLPKRPPPATVGRGSSGRGGGKGAAGDPGLGLGGWGGAAGGKRKGRPPPARARSLCQLGGGILPFHRLAAPFPTLTTTFTPPPPLPSPGTPHYVKGLTSLMDPPKSPIPQSNAGLGRPFSAHLWGASGDCKGAVGEFDPGWPPVASSDAGVHFLDASSLSPSFCPAIHQGGAAGGVASGYAL